MKFCGIMNTSLSVEESWTGNAPQGWLSDVNLRRV